MNIGYEKSGLYHLDYMKNKLNKIDTLYLSRSILECSINPNFTITSATYNNLMSSNIINLFNDPELKRRIDKYCIPSEWNALFQNRILKTA